MTVEAMCKLEELLDEDSRMTLVQIQDRLLSDLDISVSTSTIHRSLGGMLYSIKDVRVEESTMNSIINKNKRAEFAVCLNYHVARDDLVVYHDASSFNVYMPRSKECSRVGEPATVVLPASVGRNLHIIGPVTPRFGVVLMRTHDGAVNMAKYARFVADHFVAAPRTAEFQEATACNQDFKVVVMTDNTPAHSQVEVLTS